MSRTDAPYISLLLMCFSIIFNENQLHMERSSATSTELELEYQVQRFRTFFVFIMPDQY